MKQLAIGLSLIIFTLVTSAGFAQPSGHQHKEHLDRLITEYLAIHQALAGDNLIAAKSSLNAFRNEVTGNPEMMHHEEHSGMHAAHYGSMAKAVGRASDARSIAAFRVAFRDITGNLAKAIRNQDYAGKELYLMYCPMALDGEGAEWISESKQVANPYLGRVMPRCGVQKAIISNDSK